MTRDPYAVWVPSPFYTSSRNGYRPKYVILHGTAGGTSADAIARWFQNPQANVSAHYIIDQAGKIIQTVDEDGWAWANGVLSAGHDAWWNPNINANWLSISIEHVKADTQNASGLTNAQELASFALINRICDRWGIPKRAADGNGGITGHYSIDPVNRSHCPGPYPWNALWSSIGSTTQTNNSNGDLNMVEIGQGMGSYFIDAGNGRWHCHNSNVDLVGENLAFWRKYEGIFGLPLTNELYNVAAPGTALVVNERAIQIYDPGRKFDNPQLAGDCYLIHLDHGSLGQQLIAKSLTDALNQQIHNLQQQVNNLNGQLNAAQKVDHQAEVDALTTQLNSYKQAVQVVRSTLQPLN